MVMIVLCYADVTWSYRFVARELLNLAIMFATYSAIFGIKKSGWQEFATLYATSTAYHIALQK
jgi:F0F1-type ATP synthase membrane subunit a